MEKKMETTIIMGYIGDNGKENGKAYKNGLYRGYLYFLLYLLFGFVLIALKLNEGIQDTRTSNR